MKTTIGILAMAVLSLTVSCKDNKESQHSEEAHSGEMEVHDHSEMNHDNSDGHHNGSESAERAIEASTQKSPATTPIIESYLQIKNALASDNKEAATKGASAMLAAISSFDMTKIDEAQHKEYMEIIESAKEHAEHIAKSPIDHQREHFETLSTDVMDLVTLLGTDKTLYQDYCPMKKVSWLSETKEIKNPFYGSKMLTCGSVKKQIN
ncbi:DUF3347 domain-containing protein [Flavobacterium frigoris]|nr:DUF3347 domain-containing protein [Flavobacterium frigoris]